MEILITWFAQQYSLTLLVLDFFFVAAGVFVMLPCKTRRGRILTASVPLALFLIAQILQQIPSYFWQIFSVFQGGLSFLFLTGAAFAWVCSALVRARRPK